MLSSYKEHYVENDLGLWGIVNLLVMNSIELNIQCSTSFLERTLLDRTS
ncbi:hypothetical protein VCR3J2_240137 [Vibrio coralliirubri]|nr:hypothetical protein VCR3J2_240137 [Vibrio coralliirubri]